MCRQVLRYTLYDKERSSFVDASFLHNDWWQRVRDLFHPPADEDEEEEECFEGDPDCEDEEEVGPSTIFILCFGEVLSNFIQILGGSALQVSLQSQGTRTRSGVGPLSFPGNDLGVKFSVFGGVA